MNLVSYDIVTSSINTAKPPTMHIIHPCLTLVLNMCCYAFAVDADSGMTFIQIANAHVHMVQPWPSWIAPSVIACVASCLKEFKSCYSVVYEEESQICTPGAWLIPSITPVDLGHGALFSSGAFCDTDVGFNVTIHGSLIMCTQMSTVTQTYHKAKKHCKERRSNLYTLKTREKLDYLRSFYPDKDGVFWVGLDDVDKGGVYRWVDDESILTEDMKPILFQQGHPDNKSSQYCAVYNAYARFLIDIPCVDHRQYLCEVTPFSQLDIGESVRF